MANKRNRFTGGYRFARFAGQPHAQIVAADIPPLVTMDLRAAGPAPVRIQVEPGQPIEAGALIARDDEAEGNPIPASVNGTIEEIRNRADAIPVVTIRSDGTAAWKPVEGHSENWNELEPQRLEQLLYRSGAAGSVPGGIPTRYKSACVYPAEVNHILLQLVAAEVFNPDVATVIGTENLEAVAQGLAVLARIMPHSELHLVGGRSRKTLLPAMRQACGKYGINRITLDTVEDRYPNHREEILIPALLGLKYPHGRSALDLGVLFLDLHAVLAVRDAVVAGKPAIERVIALAGGELPHRPHVRARIGTPVERLLAPYLNADRPHRIIRNSLLTGQSLHGSVVDPHMTALIVAAEGAPNPPLAFSRPGFRTDSISRTFVANFLPFEKTVDTNIHGEQRPCISCAYCDSVCPVGILPHLLHRYVQRGLLDERAVRYGIFDCIDCNLCTYVCTSKIPLARLMREGKQRLIDEGLGPRPAGADPGGRELPSPSEAKP